MNETDRKRLTHVDGDGLPNVPFEAKWTETRCTYCGKMNFNPNEVCEKRVAAEESNE